MDPCELCGCCMGAGSRVCARCISQRLTSLVESQMHAGPSVPLFYWEALQGILYRRGEMFL